MNLLRFIPIKLTLLLVIGIVIGKYFGLGVLLPLTLTLVSLTYLGIVFYLDKNRATIRFGIAVSLTTLAIGLLSVSLSRSENRPHHYSNQDYSENHTWQLKIKEVLKPTPFSNRYVGDIKSLENKSTSGKILLSFASDSSAQKLHVDDEITIFEKLEDIYPPLNPHQFDYKGYLKDLGISHQFRLRKGDYFVNKNPSRTLFGMAASLRNTIIDKLKRASFGAEELSIIQALLLGQRDDISTETYNNYKNAGAVHILAVSGLHIGILLLILEFLLRPLQRLPKGRTLKLAVIVALLWGFALLAGLSASVVRAVTMFSFVAYALYLNRPSNTFNILALSMFFILLVIDPNLLFQVGFQMSYAAVFAIVWVYPLLQKLWFPKNRIVRYFWQLLSVSIAAQLGVLPISLYYFHQFPGLFFISNLFIIPVLGLILGMGILIIILALLNQLHDFLAFIYDTIIGWMNSLISWVAAQEAFIFRNISFDLVQLVLTYGIFIAFMLLCTKPNFKKVIVLAVGIIGFQSWLLYVTYQTEHEDDLFLAHQTRNTVFMYQKSSYLNVMAQDTNRIKRMITDYQVAERITSVDYIPLQNSYRWNNKQILIIDSVSVYPEEKRDFDYLILTQSPKVNLDRLIEKINPKYIIADGSNYRSYVQRWEKTCEQRKLPFHYTGESRAYNFKK